MTIPSKSLSESFISDEAESQLSMNRTQNDSRNSNNYNIQIAARQVNEMPAPVGANSPVPSTSDLPAPSLGQLLAMLALDNQKKSSYINLAYQKAQLSEALSRLNENDQPFADSLIGKARADMHTVLLPPSGPFQVPVIRFHREVAHFEYYRLDQRQLAHSPVTIIPNVDEQTLCLSKAIYDFLDMNYS